MEKTNCKRFELGVEISVGQEAIQICNVPGEVLPHCVVGFAPVTNDKTEDFVCTHLTSLRLQRSAGGGREGWRERGGRDVEQSESCGRSEGQEKRGEGSAPKEHVGIYVHASIGVVV